MDDSKPENPTPEHVNISEKRWFSITVAGAVIVSALFLMAAWEAFSRDDAREFVATLSPFGAALIAAVTFLTVVWRGTVAANLADEQRKQNRAADDANYAKLLQEGARLLADEEKQSQVLAGIATLAIVANDPARRFCTEAMDVLADYLSAAYSKSINLRPVQATIAALTRAARNGGVSTVSIHFEAPEDDWEWLSVEGLAFASFTGGQFTGEEINTSVGGYFKGVIFKVSKIAEGPHYAGCEFLACQIQGVNELQAEQNDYSGCDFSGATIRLTYQHSDAWLGRLAKRANFYRVDKPPIASKPIEWSGIFEIHPTKEDELAALMRARA